MTPEKLQNLNEEKLFNYLKDNHISDLSLEKIYSYTDCSSKRFNCSIELKCRYKHYDMLMIEIDKYRHLLETPQKNKRYIVSTPEGIYSIDITSKLPSDIKWQWCPATTEFENTNKVYKLVGFYDINGDNCKKLL